MSSDPQDPAAPLRAPETPGARMPRAILRDLRTQGLAFVGRKSLATFRRKSQFLRYRYNLRSLVRSPDRVRIDRPLFMLGTQGGGATILARCLHRHPKTLYASGNSNYWAGPDELHNSPHLYDMPEPLVHRSYHFGTVTDRVQHHPRFGYQRAWLYATDELLPQYRKSADDVDDATTDAFRQVIRKVTLAYAHDVDDCRFVDKSQLYTIQVPYIAAMLADSRPHFLLVARNPYATCARAVLKEYGAERGGYIADDLETRIRCAVEHWTNSYRLALDSATDAPLLSVRYEDFLDDPIRVVRRICEFTELEFSRDMIPAAHQRVPLGSDSYKWYPLKAAENERYLREIDSRIVDGINRRAADIVERLGYELFSA